MITSHVCAAVASALAITACATHAPRPDAPVRAPRGVEIGDLDRTADPCTDFDAFASGGWRSANPIPAGQQKWNRRAVEREANKTRIRDLLEELSARKDWPAGSAGQIVGDHYAACMDEARVDAAGLAPLAPLLAELDGIRTMADVQRGIRRLQDLAIPVPFGASGDLDNHEPAQFIENIVAGGLGLPDRDYYSKPEPRFSDARAQYLLYIASLLELGGMARPQASAAASAIFALEQRLAAATLDNAAAGDPAATDHKMTVAQLQQLAPAFDWYRWFAEARLARSDLNVAEPKFLQQLDRELRETPVAVWKSYLSWQLLDSAAPWLSKPFTEASFRFREKTLGGATAPAPRAQRCADSTEALFGDALGRMYVARYFPPAAKAKAEELSRALLAELREAVAALDWMAPPTKKIALDKLAAYNAQLGYPDKWRDDSALVIRRDAFWANVAAGRAAGVNDNRARVGKPTDRDLWRLPASSPLAYLDLQLNEIVLPAGFLRSPAFDVDATDAMNYGAFGAGLAHDMTHSIDAAPPQLDLAGRPVNWWTATDLQGFQARGQCLVDQFDGYFIEPGLHENGKLVLNEAIGDLAGVRLAYQALEKSMRTRPVPTLDGFTPEQQFFIAWGQFRNESIRLEAQRRMVKEDTHPIGRYRVIGTLANLPEFQRAFSCKPGSAMIRPAEKRCAVW